MLTARWRDLVSFGANVTLRTRFRRIATRRRLLIALSIIGSVLLIIRGGLELLVAVTHVRSKLEVRWQRSLGRNVSIGRVRVAMFSGGISIGGLAIADDPAFGDAPVITADTVIVGLDLGQLIVSRRFLVDSVRLEGAQLTLRQSAAGNWNFSTLFSPRAPPASEPPAALDVFVHHATIARSRIVVERPTARGVYDDVRLEAVRRSDTSRFSWRMSSNTPGSGAVSLAGDAGPFAEHDAGTIPFEATVDLRQVDLSATGFVDPVSELSGFIDFSGALASNGQMLNSHGAMKVSRARILPGGSAATVPIEVDYESNFNLKEQRGTVQHGDTHVGNASAQLTGTYSVTDTLLLQLRVSAAQMPLTDLESLLPAFGLKLPPAASLQQGTLAVDLAIDGPFDGATFTGPLRIQDAIVAGFDLSAKLGAMASFAGLGHSDHTVIQSLAAILRVTPDGIRADDLTLMVPTVGRLTGAGTITQGRVDFSMLATPTGSGAAGVMTGGAVRLASLGKGIPFRVQGPTDNPTFGPDMGRAVGNVVKSPGTATKAAGGILGRLFHRKKQPG